MFTGNATHKPSGLETLDCAGHRCRICPKHFGQVSLTLRPFHPQAHHHQLLGRVQPHLAKQGAREDAVESRNTDDGLRQIARVDSASPWHP